QRWAILKIICCSLLSHCSPLLVRRLDLPVRRRDAEPIVAGKCADRTVVALEDSPRRLFCVSSAAAGPARGRIDGNRVAANRRFLDPPPDSPTCPDQAEQDEQNHNGGGNPPLAHMLVF